MKTFSTNNFGYTKLGLLIGIVLLIGCSSQQGERIYTEETSLPIVVRAQKVVPIKTTITEQFPGTVRAKTKAILEAKIVGRILKLPVEVGQQVKKDQLIAFLDATEIKAKLEQAMALKDKAQQDLDRFKALLAQKAVTQAEFDAILTSYRISEAAVAEVQTMLEYAQILAPFDGLISRKFAEVGELATPGRPIVEIEDPNWLRFEASLPESLIKHVYVGQKLPVRINAIDLEIEAQISEISPSIDYTSRTVLVKLDLPNAPGLKSGMFGQVTVPVGYREVIRIPSSALIKRGQLEIVYVIKDDKAHMRLVRVGKVTPNEVEILAGIEPGEILITNADSPLKEGAKVYFELNDK